MAQIALALVGNALLPGIGGFIGAAVGGIIDRALFAPTSHPPAIGDLSAPKLEYGAQIPRLAGSNVTAGALGWMSVKRPTAVEAGGKGGGDQVVGHTYAADMILILGQHDQETVWKVTAITRVWRNGELVFSALAGATPTTYAASDGTTAWDSMELMDGGPGQLPPDVYEAAVGTPNAIGWRGRNCMLLRNARFGSSTVPPVFKVEVCTTAASTAICVPQLEFATQLLLRGEGANGSPVLIDNSAWARTVTSNGTAGAINSTDQAVVGLGSIRMKSGAGTGWATVPMTSCFQFGTGDFSIRTWIRISAGGLTGSQDIALQGSVGDPGSWVFYVLTGGGEGKLTWQSFPANNVIRDPAPGVQIPYDTWTLVEATRLGGVMTVSGGVGSASGAVIDDLNLSDVMAIGGVGNPLIGYVDQFTVQRKVGPGTVYTPGTVDLADLVSANCRRANIPAALLDVTPLVGIPVRGFASAGGVRAALAQLMQVFHFGAVCDSKLRFALRGGAAVASIPFADMGAGYDSAAEEPITIEFGNDDEVPRKLSLAYININADHDAGSVIGDRGTGNLQRMPTAEVGVVMTPSEAQKVADAWSLDGRYAATTFKLPLTEYHAQRQPTDVLTLTDRNSISYRARITGESWTMGVHEYELALDDASVFTQSGIATDNTTPTINVPLPAVPALILLDIPILRDADDSYGLYACVTADGSFKGCTVRRSRDGGTTYSVVGTLGNRAVAGTATLLAASTTWGWDDASTMTVTLSAGAGGTLSSATKAAVEADATLNVAAVGVHGRWEIVRFASATLIAANTYLVSGLLRGQFGTEHNRANHAAGDSFVLLRTTGMIRIAGEAGDVGVSRKYKAVPNFGSEAATTAVTFTSAEQGLKPYAPVDLRIDGANLAWNRRTRYASPASATAQPPLGEASEAYDAAFLDASNLLLSSQTVTAPQVPMRGAIGELYAFANDTAVRVIDVSGTVVAIRSVNGIRGAIYKLDASHARTDSKLHPTGDYQSAMSGLLAIGTNVFYSYYDGPNPSGVLKCALSDFQTTTASYTAAAAADLSMGGITTDGTHVYAALRYTGNIVKLDSSLAVATTYAAAFGPEPLRTPLIQAAGYLWWGTPSGVRKLEIATGTVTAIALGYQPQAIHVVGQMLFALTGLTLRVFDLTSSIELFSYPCVPFDAFDTDGPGLVQYNGNVCRVATRATSGRVLMLNATTGASAGEIVVANPLTVLGGDASTLWLSTGSGATVSATVSRAFGVTAAAAKVRVYQLSQSIGRGQQAEKAL